MGGGGVREHVVLDSGPVINKGYEASTRELWCRYKAKLSGRDADKR